MVYSKSYKKEGPRCVNAGSSYTFLYNLKVLRRGKRRENRGEGTETQSLVSQETRETGHRSLIFGEEVEERGHEGFLYLPATLFSLTPADTQLSPPSPIHYAMPPPPHSLPSFLHHTAVHLATPHNIQHNPALYHTTLQLNGIL